MSSIQVPELYKENILQGEQKESGRKQLSMSHILGLSVNGDENHAQLGRIDIQTGKCISSQEREEIPAKSSSCKAFSIRGYVTNIRETDINKCWPFPPHLLQRRMRKKTVPLLPPLEVPTFRYWQCLDCLVSEFNLDSLHEINNDQQQLDNLMNATPINGDGKFALGPSENEHKDLGNDMENHHLSRKVGNDLEEDEAGIEVPQCMEISERSGDASVENHKEIQHSEERVTSHGTVKDLALKNVSDGDNLSSKYEIVACNATVWPTDSEETSSAKQSLSDKDDDQILSNCTSQLRAETNTSDFTENGDHINYMHCTVNKAAVYDIDENAIFQENFENRIAEEATEPMISNIQEDNPLASFEENFENRNAEKATEALISNIQGDNTFASSIVANIDEEGFIAEVDTDGIPVKKCSSKRQKGKVKILKKRLVSDLIAVVPNEELKCNDENWKSKLKHMSRRRKNEMQRVSEAPLYSSQELKVLAEPNLEFVDDKRKVHCQDVSRQSLPPDKFVKEERRFIKRRFSSKKLGNSQKGLLSKLFEKKVHEEELVQNGSEKQEASHPEHDLLKDLAHFMAKSQIERPSTAPRSHNRKKIQFLKNSMVQNKEAEDGNCFVIENKSTEPTQFHNEQCLKDKLVKGTDASKHAAVDGEVHILIEDYKKINRVQESGKHDKQEKSGQTVETGVILESVIGISSSLNHHICKNIEKADNNIDRDASDQSVDDKGTTDNNVAIKDQRNCGFCTLLTKLIECPEKLYKLNRDDSSKNVIIESETRLLNEDGKEINQVQQSGKHEKQKTTGQDKEENDGLCTLQTKSIEHLGKIFKSNCNDSAKHATMDSENSLLIEDGKKIDQVQESDKHEKQKTSGQAKEVHVEDTVIGISSSSDHHTCQNTEAVDRNMKIGSSDQSVGDKGTTDNDVAIKDQRNCDFCALLTKLIECPEKLYKSNRDISAKNVIVESETCLLIEDGKKIKQVQQSGKHEKQKTTGQDKGENDGLCTLQTKSIEHLGKIFKSNCNDSAKHVTMDSENSLLVEDGKKINQVQESDKHEKQKTSGQDKEVHVEDTVIGISSSSDDHTYQNTEAVNRNMKIGSSNQSICDKGSTGNNVITKAQRNNGSFILKSQSIDHLREALNSKRDQLSMIKHCSASLDPAVHGLSSTSFEDRDNGLDESGPSNSCKDDIQNLNNGSENPVPMNSCKENSISSLETVAATKKRKAGDRHGVTVLPLRRGTRPNRTQTKEVKQVRLDGRTAQPFVPPLFHFDALDNPLKLNHDQPSIIEQSHASLYASIHDFPAASFEANDVKLDESVAHNSHNDDLQNHNNGSEQAVLKSTCKNTSLNASQNIDVKRIQPDSSKAASVVLGPFQSNDLAETSKSNRNQMSIIDQSNSSLDASFYGFSATGFECYDNRLDQSVTSNSRKNTLHSQNIDSEQSVLKSACKDTSSNTNKTVAAPTFAQTNVAVSAQPDMSLHSQSRLINPNLIRDFKNSTNSSSKASQVYHTESYLKGNRDLTSFSTGDNSLLTGPQPIMGENFITNLSLSSPERGFMSEGSVGIVKQRKGQVYQKQGTCVTQTIRAFPVLNDISMGHKPSNKVGSQSSFDCNLPYSTMKTTSLDADPMTNADEQQPLRSPIILSFAQGNKLDAESTLSRECFDQSKFELMSYIDNRIQHYCSSEAPRRIATQKAEKGPQDEDFQIAASQDPDFCRIRKNVAEHRGLKDNPTKKRKVGNRQKIAVLALSADRQSTRNKEVRQAQPDSSTTPPIVPPLFQSKALETVMNIPDGQSCRGEMRVEESHGYTYHQSIIPGEKMNTVLENPDKQIPKRRKIINGKQAQIESQSLEPAAIALSKTNLRKAKVNSRLKVTTRNTELSGFACLKNIRHADGTVLSQKYVSEAEIETAKNNRELDVQCHSTQTGTCAMDNHTSIDNNPSSLDLSSAASQFAGFKHVLKPIAQNTQQHLPVSFIADNKDEAAEVSLKVSKRNITDSKKKLKAENQLPEIYNSYNLQAIGNYIKWGTLNAELPTLHASLSKNGAGMPFQTEIDQNGNFMNSSDSGIHPNVVELDNYMLGAAMSRTSPSTFPSHVTNTQIVTSSCSSNTNIGIPHHFNIFNPVCSDVNIMPGLLKPLGMSEQHGLLCQIQEYVDKSKLYVSSFTHADKPLSASFDSSAKKT